MSTESVAFELINREIREQDKRAAKHAHTEPAHHKHAYAADRLRLLGERISAAAAEKSRP